MKRLAVVVVALPGAALADGSEIAHAHPHGVETLWIAVAAFLVGGVASWILARRK